MKLDHLLENEILFDSHCHLNNQLYDVDRSTVINNAVCNNVEYIVDISVNIPSSKKVAETAAVYPQVLACIGVDPEIYVNGSDLQDRTFTLDKFGEIEKLIDENTVMLGETGMDLYWNTKNNVSNEIFEESYYNQKKLFESHIELSSKYNLPMSIHSRNSIDECIDVINNSSLSKELITQGVFHSLTPDLDDDENSFYEKLNKIFEAGFLVGLNGIITYKNAKMLRDTIIKVIKERICDFKNITPFIFYQAGFVFETDGPYLSPEGRRSQRNEPANVAVIYNFISEVLNKST